MRREHCEPTHLDDDNWCGRERPSRVGRIDQFPARLKPTDSANVYDSLGEAYANPGDRELATHWGGRRKADQKTNVIFAICNGGATMRRETLRIPRRR